MIIYTKTKATTRVPTLHLTLLALHPLTLNITLAFAPGAGRNIPPNHQISAPAQYSHKTSTFSFTLPPSIASVCLCNWLSVLRGIMSIRRSICSSNRSMNTTKIENTRSRVMGRLLSTTMSDSQSSVGGARQRGGRGGRVKGVSEAMTSVFQA